MLPIDYILLMTSNSNFLKKSFQMIGDLFTESNQKKMPNKVVTPVERIYPPGAVDDFADVCGACGDCRSVCPVDCIKFSPDELTGKELAVIVPSEKACTMCEDLRCTYACQQGALIPPTDYQFTKIGLAKIVPDKCLPYNGKSCTTCFDACPLKNEAIRLEFNRPVIYDDKCTGCGICEEVCILFDSKGIKIQILLHS